MKGRCPRPLDDGGLFLFTFNNIADCFENVNRFGEIFFAAVERGRKSAAGAYFGLLPRKINYLGIFDFY